MREGGADLVDGVAVVGVVAVLHPLDSASARGQQDRPAARSTSHHRGGQGSRRQMGLRLRRVLGQAERQHLYASWQSLAVACAFAHSLTLNVMVVRAANDSRDDHAAAGADRAGTGARGAQAHWLCVHVSCPVAVHRIDPASLLQLCTFVPSPSSLSSSSCLPCPEQAPS